MIGQGAICHNPSYRGGRQYISILGKRFLGPKRFSKGYTKLVGA